jgi:hypothetical protein
VGWDGKLRTAGSVKCGEYFDWLRGVSLDIVNRSVLVTHLLHINPVFVFTSSLLYRFSVFWNKQFRATKKTYPCFYTLTSYRNSFLDMPFCCNGLEHLPVPFCILRNRICVLCVCEIACAL